jgi:hypothetical protein
MYSYCTDLVFDDDTLTGEAYAQLVDMVEMFGLAGDRCKTRNTIECHLCQVLSDKVLHSFARRRQCDMRKGIGVHSRLVEIPGSETTTRRDGVGVILVQ